MKKRFVLWKATERCNCRCNICGIWKKNKIINHNPKKIYNHARVLNITGGEPFLRDDLAEIQERYFPNVRLVQISSNGLVRNIPELVSKFKPKVSVTLSVHGIGHTHDDITGVNNSYWRMIDTGSSLAIMKNVRVGYQYTLQENNIKDAFNFWLIHNNTTFNALIDDYSYYRKREKQADKDYKDKVIDFLMLMRKEDRLRRYYYDHVIETWEDRRTMPCMFGDFRAIYINERGYEQACPYMDSKCSECISLCDSVLHPMYYPFNVIKRLMR